MKKTMLPDDTVRLVEQHFIGPSDPRFATIDAAAFASKNIYNLTNYEARQHFFTTGHILSYETLYHRLKKTDAFVSLPQKVSQQTVLQVARAWKGFQEARKAYRQDPARFLGPPRMPGYKPKQAGRAVLTYPDQALSRPALAEGLIVPSGLDIQVSTAHRQVRIVPRRGGYGVEVVYLQQITSNPALDPALVTGLDIGVDALATITANKAGFQPLIINGRPLKALNQFYHKRKAALQSQLENNRQTSARINRMNRRRDGRLTPLPARRQQADCRPSGGRGPRDTGYRQE